MTKARTTIYLPQDTLIRLRKLKDKINVSQICQEAVEAALETHEEDRKERIRNYFIDHTSLNLNNKIAGVVFKILSRLPNQIFMEMTTGGYGPVSIDILAGPSFATACFYELRKPAILISPDLAQQEQSVITGAVSRDIAFLHLQFHGLSRNRYHRTFEHHMIRFPGERAKPLRDSDDEAIADLIDQWGFKDEYKAYFDYLMSNTDISFDITDKDLKESKNSADARDGDSE